MWDEGKRQRFQRLREHDLQASLSPADRAELDHMIAEIEAEEACYLRPATERMQQETEAIERRNEELEALIFRKEALLARLRAVLAEAQNESQAMHEELKRILRGDSEPVETGFRH